MASRNDIPIGRTNAVTRGELARKWRCSEREARHILAGLRAAPCGDEYAILSTANSPPGYWRSNDATELTCFIRDTENRAQNTFLAIRDVQRVLNSLYDRIQ